MTPTAPAAAPMGRVYFVWAEGTDLFKIGFTNRSVRKRTMAIQQNSPFRIHVLGAIPGDKKTEQIFHQLLRMFQFKGEWFRLHEASFWLLMEMFGADLPADAPRNLQRLLASAKVRLKSGPLS